MQFKRRLSYQTQLYLFLMPYLLGVLLLVVLPAILAFGLAFFKYDGLSAPQWVGTLNFVFAYTDELFGLSIHNSLALVVLPVPIRVLGAFILARLMQHNGRLLTWFRAGVFLPSIIPGAAYALAWLWIFNPLYGPLNLLLRAIGLMPPAWLVEPQWAKPALALMMLWQIGEGFLVSLAALQDLPTAVNEAAIVDGANIWQRFWRIQLPLLAPILLLLTFRDAVLTFQESFTTVLLTTGGGPYYASYMLPLLIYEQGFDLLLFGVASAALWALYLLTGLIVLAIYLIARQWQIGTTEETFVL